VSHLGIRLAPRILDAGLQIFTIKDGTLNYPVKADGHAARLFFRVETIVTSITATSTDNLSGFPGHTLRLKSLARGGFKGKMGEKA